MKKISLLVLIVIGVIFACNQANNTTETETAPPGFVNSFCDSATNGGLCSYLPLEVHLGIFEGYDSDLDSIHQPPFDVFSWQTFVALNWPADINGNPVGNSLNDNTQNPRVWEYYQDPLQVFGSDDDELVLQLGEAVKAGDKFFHKSSKAPGQLDTITGFQEADGHPLIDRNLNFALYEIKMSPAEVNFITTNKLTTVNGIGEYYVANKNQFVLPPSDSASNKQGMAEIKAAWRILDPSKGDDTTRFYCRNARVYIDSAHSRNGKAISFKAKVGLVGLHIFRTTTRFGLGVWSTFEQVDNTPDSPQMAQDSRKTQWSFYNPQCLNCPLNQPPEIKPGESAYLWDPAPPYAASYAVSAPSQPQNGKFGTQAIRQFPIFSLTDYINRLWRAKLKGTVWANYRLIGSQWQNAETFPPPNAPALLANTTLETYIQSFASCISCHQGAVVQYVPDAGDTINIRTDLSFLFPVYAR
ncbi:MAG: hypothetical protein ABL876_16355 [Chitinophagaceae bacterium]